MTRSSRKESTTRRRYILNILLNPVATIALSTFGPSLHGPVLSKIFSSTESSFAQFIDPCPTFRSNSLLMLELCWTKRNVALTAVESVNGHVCTQICCLYPNNFCRGSYFFPLASVCAIAKCKRVCELTHCLREAVREPASG